LNEDNLKTFIYVTQQFCCVLIPDLDKNGNLREGIHRASWDEIQKRYGYNEYRRKLLDGLLIALYSLKSAGCKIVYLDGSFITVKRYPRDFDCVWDVNCVDPKRLHRIFQESSERQKFVFGGEFYPTSIIEGLSNSPFLEFFQTDKETLERKGIIMINLGDLP